VRVAVTATGTRGTSPAVASDPTSVVALPDAPSLTAVPWIDGDLLVGSTLRVEGGDWGSRTGPLTFEYRWQRCADADGMECEWIDDAESASYVLTTADLGSTMAVQVRAVNATGWAQAWVGPTDFVAQP
jgi:hypothetical protein